MNTPAPTPAPTTEDIVFDPMSPRSDVRIVARAFDMLIEELANSEDISVVETLRATIARFSDDPRPVNVAGLAFLQDQLLDWI